MIIKTKNLTLRPWRDSDAECLYHFAKNPNIGPVAGWPPHESVEDSLNIIRTVFSKKETYAVITDDIPIGCVGLLFHPDTNHWWGEGAVELGYWIAEEYWGKGYATEASKAVLKRAFSEYEITAVYASYRADNPKSGRVLEKLGFKYYADLTNVNYKNETFVEVAVKLEK